MTPMIQKNLRPREAATADSVPAGFTPAPVAVPQNPQAALSRAQPPLSLLSPSPSPRVCPAAVQSRGACTKGAGGKKGP